ncbi:hypothetical protein GL218_08926 [Daldinia childiae]|uniref:uncharacterized protein n=1 Tax=Daldinia childiae TaxID=326645 RepID=UPI0014480648|nr:uncharacterized protein GL218_08926 [Daldinia childiae]KAF3067113.1 hypothetical protein GL218_08926 [Daldinia childiae]
MEHPTFEKLRDLREKYPGGELAQNYALTRQIPRRFRMGTGRLNKGDYDKMCREAFALDAAIVVARHLLAAVADRYRQIKSGSPLARMIWADLEDTDSFQQQQSARMAILESFREKRKGEQISFYSVMESQEMLDTLWCLPAFQLWHPTVMAKKEGTKKWEKTEVEDPALLTRKALINYSGAGDLGAHISDSFGMFLDGNIVQHWKSNEPVVIRVFHSNNAQAEEPKTWKDLREIWVKSHRLRDVEDETGRATRRYDKTGGPPKRYILLATVRLGAWKEENDRVRLYGADGEYVHLPKDTINYAGIEWTLGTVGDRYLLYYRLATLPPAVGGSGSEFVVRPPALGKKHAMMVAAVTMKSRGQEQSETDRRRDPVPTRPISRPSDPSTSNVGLPLAARITMPQARSHTNPRSESQGEQDWGGRSHGRNRRGGHRG